MSLHTKITLFLISIPLAVFSTTVDLDDGYFGFDYTGGSMSGTFYVSGIPDTTSFPTEGAGGYHTMYNDSVIAVFSGIEAISQDSVNVGIVFLHQPGELTTGSYSVDLFNQTAVFGFGVGIDAMIDLDSLTSFEDIEAEKIYVSMSGTITVDEITETDITGTFNGYLVNYENPIDMLLVTNGEFSIFNTDMIDIDPTITAVDIPTQFVLHDNYPNPFNPNTEIRYELYLDGAVQLRVFDIYGRELDVLVNDDLPAGSYSIKWDGSGYSSGVYFYQLVSGASTVTKKMLLIK